MRRAVLFLLLTAFCSRICTAEEPMATDVVLGIHGGAGSPRSEVSPELDKRLRDGLTRSLKAGFEVLKKPKATSLDAVETAIRILEDDPWFNAGKGAVFTHEGRNELDASIMEGRVRKAGAIASVTNVKNPISAARAVMEKSRHVLFVGEGAEKFARESGLEIVDPSYFRTEHRWQQLQEILKEEASRPEKKGAALAQRTVEWSTVGAVAVDRDKNTAAGTSTGGMSNKKHGRVGDSPIIGAGTWADNATCAVSCTGHGEYFIRYGVAHDIAALREYQQLSVQEAADKVIKEKLVRAGGEGAAIVLDAQGNFATSYNGDGLYRGWITSDGTITVKLYDE
jgi:L-asparaginase / beta-aspartyl-peptidase